ncbi:MAG: DUF5615 family PIN-like protein [Thermomicrobiales bacterium]
MRILIDQNIPMSVATMLELKGHAVSHVRDVLRQDTPDAVISCFAERERFVIVTHDPDFKRFREQTPMLLRPEIRLMAGRITLGPTGPAAAQRLEDVHELVVGMHERAIRRELQFWVDITNVSVRLVDFAGRGN